MNISLKSFFLLVLLAHTSLFAAAGEFPLSKPSRNRSQHTLYQALVMPGKNSLKIACFEIKDKNTLLKETKLMFFELQGLKLSSDNEKDLKKIAKKMIKSTNLNHLILAFPHTLSGKNAAIKSFITDTIFPLMQEEKNKVKSDKSALMILFRVKEEEAKYDELTELLQALSLNA